MVTTKDFDARGKRTGSAAAASHKVPVRLSLEHGIVALWGKQPED